MKIRVSAEDAAWTLREAAWGLEEKLLRRGSRTRRERALDRAQRSTAPLQRLIETKLAWPLADAIRERGTAARAGIATAAVAAALTAGAAGAIVAPDNDPGQPNPAPTPRRRHSVGRGLRAGASGDHA